MKKYLFLCMWLALVSPVIPAAPPAAFRQRLQAMVDRKLDVQVFERLEAAEPALAELYVALREEHQWASRLKPIMGEDPLITAAMTVLEAQAGDLLRFYGTRIDQAFLGDPDPMRAPDLLVVLGCNQPMLGQRLELALELAERFPEIPIVASGGGRTYACEAQAISRHLLDHGVAPGRILQEDLSLDTLGNAVFSKLLIKERLLPARNILVVTSSSHGPRSLFLFRKVFGPTYAVAVALARTPGDAATLERRMDGEIKGIAALGQNMLTLSREAGSEFGQDPHLDGDETGILDMMLLDHELYRYRWDLARRFHLYRSAQAAEAH